MGTTGIVTPTLVVEQVVSGGTWAQLPPFGEDGSTSLDWERLNPLAEVFISTIRKGDDSIRNQLEGHEHLLNAKAKEFTPSIPIPVGKHMVPHVVDMRGINMARISDSQFNQACCMKINVTKCEHDVEGVDHVPYWLGVGGVGHVPYLFDEGGVGQVPSLSGEGGVG